MPSGILSDEQFLEKLVTASVISELYVKHNILSFYGANTEIPLIISLPLVATEIEVNIALKSIDQTLERGAANLVTSFVKNKFSASK